MTILKISDYPSEQAFDLLPGLPELDPDEAATSFTALGKFPKDIKKALVKTLIKKT